MPKKTEQQLLQLKKNSERRSFSLTTIHLNFTTCIVNDSFHNIQAYTCTFDVRMKSFEHGKNFIKLILWNTKTVVLD